MHPHPQRTRRRSVIGLLVALVLLATACQPHDVATLASDDTGAP